ncbi:unnamed protein product [Soboliphyme baturini]|uniref:Integrase n=1 Tax=Soboliphyme baturini TaxID=241478 RepID=A0A183J5J1_9BILA|nr:unnamed protein product [Soboliphyme baturini]
MAARDGLKNYWRSSAECTNFAFGDEGHSLDVSPLMVEEMYIKYKEKIQKAFGTPYRRHLRHRFYPGTVAKRTPRRVIAPKPFTI